MMKTKAEWEAWFERRYGPDPRHHLGYDAIRFRQEWTDGLLAQRDLRFATGPGRFALQIKVTRGELARIALDAAERWELMHSVAFDTWSAMHQTKRRKKGA